MTKKLKDLTLEKQNNYWELKITQIGFHIQKIKARQLGLNEETLNNIIKNCNDKIGEIQATLDEYDES